MNAITPWWDADTGDMIGAILGASFGIVGGGFGAFVGVMASRGKAGSWVIACEIVLLVIGIGLALFGLCALALGQPRAVWYPFLLTGGVVVFVMAAMIPMGLLIRRAVEQRKLAANELRHG